MRKDEMRKVLAQALNLVKPSVEEKKKVMKLFEKIKEFIEQNYGLEARLMGSVAKDTFLRGARDLDIFVLFPVDVSREELEKKGLEIGRAVFEHFGGKDVVVAYAEHPYTRGVIDGFEVEIVPAYKIKDASQLKSAVDRTPFHTDYVLKNLRNHDDVRLLKAFLKAIGAYGSDLKTAGFSGYLCEVLIIHCGDFISLLEACQRWGWQEIIDPAGHYSRKDYSKLRRMFKGQPLIVVDPVDPKRNVAAALSAEKLALFIYAARKFMEKPSIKFFQPIKIRVNKKAELEKLKKEGRKVYALVLERPAGVMDDTLYPQLKKLADNIKAFLEHNEFVVEDTWIFGDEEVGVGFEVVDDRLPLTRIMKGPRIFDDVKHQERFVSKHKVVWIGEGGRFYAREKRKYRNVRELISYHLSGSFEEIRQKGVPKHIARSVTEHGYLLFKNEELREVKSREFWEGLVKFNLRKLERLE